jgi:hypothetical protein
MNINPMEDAIPPEVVRALVEAGRAACQGLGCAVPFLMQIQHQGAVNRKHWESWDAITRAMRTEDVVDLVRGLALADSLPGWSGGSVAGVVWVWRELERRDVAELRDLAEWVVKHDPNGYAPFGTMKHRESRLARLAANKATSLRKADNQRLEAELRGRLTTDEYEEALGAWLAASLRGIKDAQEAQALLRNAVGQIAALGVRLTAQEGKLATLESQIYRKNLAEKREALLRDGAALSSVERLRLVATRSDIPIGVFPVDWASVASSVLLELDRATRLILAARIRDRRTGPWRRLHKTLCEIDGQ